MRMLLLGGVLLLFLGGGCLRSSVRCEDIGVPDGPNGMCVCPDGYRLVTGPKDDDRCLEVEDDAGVAEDYSPRSETDDRGDEPRQDEVDAATTPADADDADNVVVVPDGKDPQDEIDAATTPADADDADVVVPDGKDPQDEIDAGAGAAADAESECQADEDCGESVNECGTRHCSSEHRCTTLYAAEGDACPGGGDGYCNGLGALSSCVECTDGQHCPGEHCVGSRCVECVNDSNCSSTEECNSQGECQEKCGNGKIDDDEECDPAMQPHACSSRCEAKNWLSYCQGSSWMCTGGTTCKPPQNYCAEPCGDVTDCPDSRYVCEDGYCAFPCTSDADCPGADDGLQYDTICLGTCVPSLL